MKTFDIILQQSLISRYFFHQIKHKPNTECHNNLIHNIRVCNIVNRIFDSLLFDCENEARFVAYPKITLVNLLINIA